MSGLTGPGSDEENSNPAASSSEAGAPGHSLLSGRHYLPGESINWVWPSPPWVESSSIRLPEPVPLPEADPNLIPKLTRRRPRL